MTAARLRRAGARLGAASAPWILLAGPATAQDAGATVAFWVRWAAALLLCLALAVAGAYSLRARQSRASATGRPLAFGPTLAGLLFRRAARPEGDAERIRLLATLPLRNQVEVSLIRVDDQDWLLASGPGGALSLQPARGSG